LARVHTGMEFAPLPCSRVLYRASSSSQYGKKKMATRSSELCHPQLLEEIHRENAFSPGLVPMRGAAAAAGNLTDAQRGRGPVFFGCRLHEKGRAKRAA
jgi:hypothetical protein